MYKEIKKVGIAGAGTMGASMAETFARHSYNVILFDISEDALEKAMHSIRVSQRAEVDARMVAQNQSDACIARICCTTDMRMFADVDLLIEAIVENMEVKRSFWAEVSKLIDRSALLASNTSGLGISQIAEAIVEPSRFAGMHWMNPPNIIPLIELVRGEKTDLKTLETLRNLCIAIGKKPVVVADVPGFVLNRIQLAVLRECLHIVEQGIASPEDVDAVMKYALGLRYACLGPFEVVDHGGIDIFHNIASYLFADLSDAKESFGLLKECFESGRLGVKTQKGFYDYCDGKDEEAILHRDRMYTKIVDCLLGDD